MSIWIQLNCSGTVAGYTSCHASFSDSSIWEDQYFAPIARLYLCLTGCFGPEMSECCQKKKDPKPCCRQCNVGTPARSDEDTRTSIQVVICFTFYCCNYFKKNKLLNLWIILLFFRTQNTLVVPDIYGLKNSLHSSFHFLCINTTPTTESQPGGQISSMKKDIRANIKRAW